MFKELIESQMKSIRYLKLAIRGWLAGESWKNATDYAYKITYWKNK